MTSQVRACVRAYSAPGDNNLLVCFDKTTKGLMQCIPIVFVCLFQLANWNYCSGVTFYECFRIY